MEETRAATAVCDEHPSPVDHEQAEKLDDRQLLLLYRQTGDQELKWMLAMRYTPLVRRIALGLPVPDARCFGRHEIEEF